MNISRPRMMLPLVLTAVASVPVPHIESPLDNPSNRQPHGHSSSQGSTSNRTPKSKKKKKNKIASKSRGRNRG